MFTQLLTLGRIAALTARVWSAQAAVDAGCNTAFECRRAAEAIETGDCNADDSECQRGEAVTGDDAAPYCTVFVCRAGGV